MKRSKISFLLVSIVTLMAVFMLGTSVKAVDWSDYEWRPLLEKGDIEIEVAEVGGHRVIPGENNIRIGRKNELVPMKIRFETHDLSEGDLVYYKVVRFGALETFGAAEETLKKSSVK